MRASEPAPTIAAVLLLLGGACVAPPRGGEVVRELIAAGNRGDFEAVLDCYTDDIVWAPPWGAEMRGREAIAAHYRTLFATNVLQLVVHIEAERPAGGDVEVHATVRGSVLPRAGGEPVVAEDRIVATLRRGPGGLRVCRLAWQPAGK